jgi:hypothetical protein
MKHEVELKIMETLGLPTDNVTEVVIRFAAEAEPRATITQLVDMRGATSERIDGLRKIVSDFDIAIKKRAE